MTVKELINELLDCPMDAEVDVLVEIHKDLLNERLNEYSHCAFPVADCADVKEVFMVCKSQVRIILDDASEWG